MFEVIRSKDQSEFSAQQARGRMSFERVMVGLSSAGVMSAICALCLHDWLIAGAIIAATLLSLKLLLNRAVSAHHDGSPAPAAAACRRPATAAGAAARHDLGRRARQRFEEKLSWQRQARRLLVAYDRIDGAAHVERHQAPASREPETV